MPAVRTLERASMTLVERVAEWPKQPSSGSGRAVNKAAHDTAAEFLARSVRPHPPDTLARVPASIPGRVTLLAPVPRPA